MLSAIDHNEHLNRPLSRDINGQPRYRRSYNKASSQWTVKKLKEPKGYQYLPQLMHEALQQRVRDDKTVGRTVGISENDPVRLAPTLAKSGPPSTLELIARQKTRTGELGAYTYSFIDSKVQSVFLEYIRQ